MACGLANRMFQYAYYLSLKEKGYDAKVDFYKAAALAVLQKVLLSIASPGIVSK